MLTPSLDSQVRAVLVPPAGSVGPARSIPRVRAAGAALAHCQAMVLDGAGDCGPVGILPHWQVGWWW